MNINFICNLKAKCLHIISYFGPKFKKKRLVLYQSFLKGLTFSLKYFAFYNDFLRTLKLQKYL